MADIIDEVIEAQEAKPEDITQLTDEEVKADVTEEPIPEPNEDDDLPEKYRGKSKAELARMHEEAQSALGRQSNEVGELRKVFDDYIMSSKSTQEEAPNEDPVDFLLEPEKAIEQKIDNHPRLKQAEEALEKMRQLQVRDKVMQDFPNIQEVLSDPRFMEWKNSSTIRKQLFDNMDKNFDYDSTAELMNGWNDRNRVVENAKQMEQGAQKEAVKEAATGTARGNPDNKVRKKIYRRADIIKLMKEDRARYDALQPEIMQAYAEGRVK